MAVAVRQVSVISTHVQPKSRLSRTSVRFKVWGRRGHSQQQHPGSSPSVAFEQLLTGYCASRFLSRDALLGALISNCGVAVTRKEYRAYRIILQLPNSCRSINSMKS